MTETKQRSSVRFCGRAYHALALTPESPVNDWLAELDRSLSRSPGFFAGKAVVVDISKLSLSKQDLAGLIADMAARGIRILAVEGADPAWADRDLPPFLTGGRPEADESAQRPAPQTAPEPSSLVIDVPVRSGQSIVNPHGDVTVVGSVSSGADVIAAGSVHVYGALRGRALAGAYGDAGARIFCRRLEAELMAINGHYLVADDVEPRLRNKAIHAWLDGETLQIISLD